MSDPAFGYWLAGFTDGEGCFTIKSVSGYYYCCLERRWEDMAALKERLETNRKFKEGPCLSG